jgi:hypothetical protein
MKFKLNIDCNSDAFHDDHMAEIARILRAAAARVEDLRCTSGSLADANGNSVCTFLLGSDLYFKELDLRAAEQAAHCALCGERLDDGKNCRSLDRVSHDFLS